MIRPLPPNAATFTLTAAAFGLALALAVLGGRPACAWQGAPAAGGKAPQAAGGAIVPVPVKRPPGLRGEIQQELDYAEQELVELASVVPPEKFSWRPGPGVRSFGEVYMHVASANYFFPTFWGAKPPSGVDPRGFEKEGADKTKTVATLKASFDYLRQAIGALSDAEMGKAIQMFGHATTPAEATLIAATHAHEHLGQAIAYARSTGVVPPWSAGQGQGGQ